jgi:hypothetical protein
MVSRLTLEALVSGAAAAGDSLYDLDLFAGLRILDEVAEANNAPVAGEALDQLGGRNFLGGVA